MPQELHATLEEAVSINDLVEIRGTEYFVTESHIDPMTGECKAKLKKNDS